MARLLILVLLLQTIGLRGYTQDKRCIKKRNIAISVGYGAPSVLRTYLKARTNRDEYTIVGSGPFMLKAEYMLTPRWSLGLTGSYSYSKIFWMMDSWDTVSKSYKPYEFGIEAREIAASLRSNYHFFVNKNWDLYGGLGFGVGRFSLRTYTTSPTNQFFTSFDIPEPYSMEATVGGRYFLHKNLAIYSELGVGKAWLIFKSKIIPDALFQAGITLKI